MILVLIFLVVITSALLLVTKRNQESLLVFGLCATLFIMWLGTLTYIAKKGGISFELQLFLFLTAEIKTKLQYVMCTLGQLGYTVAIGRYLFPLLFVQTAIYYSMQPVIRKLWWLRLAACVVPLLSLIIYIPKVFEHVTRQNLTMQRILVEGSSIWIVVYLLAAFGLLIYEYSHISLRFCRRQFGGKCVMLCSLAILYLFYFQQDPAQIYLFYRSDYMWLLGLWYLSPSLSLRSYMIVLIVTLISSVAGFTSLIRYTQRNMRDDQDEIVLQRKFDAASMGASVFVHSIKNQLLANRVLHKRMIAMCGQPQPDTGAILGDFKLLQENNEAMIAHVEELYNTIKAKRIYLVPVSLGEIADTAVQRFKKKYPEGLLQVEIERDIIVLVDASRLSEALYNLLLNAWEATLGAGRGDCPVKLLSHRERLYTVFEVRDNGVGIPKKLLGRIFEPFYSSKNTNYNWGMGMYYVRTIAKNHLGSVRVESTHGEGTRVYLLLPKYDARNRRQ